jgi:GNAT superfamily N-acetyltransferase
MMSAVHIRPAHADEAEILSDLAMRAKAHWGYDDAFLEACRQELSVPPEQIAAGTVWVADAAGTVLGFIDLRIADGAAELDACFVAPPAIGSGVGRALWEKAEALARDAGAAKIGLDSDPYAEGFYLAMGAMRVGEAPSGSIPGRVLPRMMKQLG